MVKPAVFFDVGGVLLTNGWDRPARRRTAEHFALDWEEFQSRHESAVRDFETGRMTLEAYFDRTVFWQPRDFTREAFRDMMFAQSEPYAEALAFVAELARSGRFLLAALNNESKELNQYRIDRFKLREQFSLFLSSCYLGLRKPEERIYRTALEITQWQPYECLFIDDRAENVQAASAIGIRSIQYRGVADLQPLFATV
jgi:putative hydrolase of the HAD superfamily